MNTYQKHDVADEDIAPIVDFGRRNPLEIGVALRNLANRGDFLTAQYGDGQIVTRLLDVDVTAHRFTFDWGGLEEQNRGVLASQKLIFSASPDGVRVEFTTPGPRETTFDGRPAFEVDFPTVLYYMQRREYFRVEAPVLDPYVCTGTLPDGERFRFEVHDLSLGGVALRTMDERVADLEMGIVLQDAELHFSANGRVTLDMMLVSHRESTTAKGDRRYTIGFKFVSMPGSAENTLQRLITQLEMKRRSLAK
ncbi:YcgR protein superfamily protein [Caballeronia glebae]|jgi:c-di-GMP-binding flagellar brake protein YcgR|uniref:Flagellar brake protein YcgR n=1 Tax=Caballeronia glebae TaxID=1777143 RepID=A0A158DHM6_9BURK|nr:flagellar brake protein [Caballeronia glebae]SAK93973.1 YcgR protein superfamily protein [Caballeronia glebae]